MSLHRIFPRRNAGFNTAVNRIIPYLQSNVARLKLDAGKVNALVLLLGNWNGVYLKTVDKSVATTSLRNERNGLRKKMEKEIRDAYADIPRSALTTADYAELNLKQRDLVRTRPAKMDHAPVMGLRSMGHTVHTLHFRNPATPDSQGQPKGQKIILEYFIGEPGLKPADIPYNRNRTVTRFLYMVMHDAKDVGKTIYYRCCYENTRGERGPHSNVLSLLIA